MAGECHVCGAPATVHPVSGETVYIPPPGIDPEAVRALRATAVARMEADPVLGSIRYAGQIEALDAVCALAKPHVCDHTECQYEIHAAHEHRRAVEEYMIAPMEEEARKALHPIVCERRPDGTSHSFAFDPKGLSVHP